MIKTQELKSQIDELTKHNDMVLLELEQLKKLLTQNENQLDQKSASNESSSGNQDEGKCEQQASDNQNQKNGDVSQLANDLLVIKDLVEKLEKKTSQYISEQSSGSLTEKDVVNLILTLMNGMVDWTNEFVTGKSHGSKQLQ